MVVLMTMKMTLAFVTVMTKMAVLMKMKMALAVVMMIFNDSGTDSELLKHRERVKMEMEIYAVQ